MKTVTIKKSTYNLVKSKSLNIFRFCNKTTDELNDTVTIEVSSKIHQSLLDQIKPSCSSIDEVIISLCK